MKLESKKIIAIVGPTASGKTKLSIELAKRYNGEIINGDSVQVYKGLDIGSAKITPKEMQGVKHHLIDIKNPEEEYSVADFQRDCRKAIDDINKREKTAIIVGGSGLYISSVLFDYRFEKLPEDTLQINSKTLEELQEIYYSMDRKSEAVDVNNYPRLKNFVYKLSYGMDVQKDSNSNYYDEKDYIILGLSVEREVLYERINNRVDKMIESGLVKEVGQFSSDMPSQTAIGYKEIHEYLIGEITLDEAIELVKRNSRRFAKKQMTWLRNKMNINWIEG